MRSDRNNPHILVVENDDIYRRWLRFALEQAGYEVVVCADHDEAAALVDDLQRPVDLMLLDLWPPYPSAHVSGQRLHEQHPEAELLFMSVQTPDQLNLEGVVVGSEAFLQKPLRRPDLLRRLRERS